MANQFKKDPDATLDYSVDWGTWMESSETLSVSTWVVPSGITKDSDTISGTEAVAWLSGGTAGSTYELTNRITTDAGRTDDRSITIYVRQR